VRKYEAYGDLPRDLRVRIEAVEPADPARWAGSAIPALGGRSILEVMNENGGDTRVREFIARIEGLWFDGAAN
jgi:hypothetical protein